MLWWTHLKITGYGYRVILLANKLRTYSKFKNTFSSEPYLKMTLTRKQRSALAKFRCGVAPLRLETGRYENLPVIDRTCRFCVNEVEDEEHVVTRCPVYDNIRDILFEKASDIDANVMVITVYSYRHAEKLHFVLSNENCAKFSAKALADILTHRRNLIYR